MISVGLQQLLLFVSYPSSCGWSCRLGFEVATYPVDKVGPLPNNESVDVITLITRSYVIMYLST